MSFDPSFDLDPVMDTAGNVTVPMPNPTPQKVLIAVLDTSGSMAESASDASSAETGGVVFSRMDLVKHSMRTVAAMMGDTPNTSLALISFDSAAKSIMKTSSSMDQANRGIDSLYPGGATNIWDGLRAAIQEAEEVYRRNPAADIHICLLTDGEPTESLLPPAGLRETLRNKLLKTVPLKIHTFGFGYRLDSKLLYDLCVIGGGMYGYIPDCSMVASVFINYCATILSKGAPIPLDNTHRNQLVSVLKGITVDGAGHCPEVGPGKNPFAQVQTYLATSAESPMCEALLVDIDSADPNKGQLMKALSCYDWFKRWGYNHILAYCRALELGICANFKDQALQLFATESFKEIQAKGNELFAEIPAPIPQGYTQASFAAMATATGFTMDMFNTADGGCFGGECIVSLANGKTKYVKECVRGDVLDNGSVIRCVVRRRVSREGVGREVKMVRFPGPNGGGLLITPWHPVRPSESVPWIFPCLWLNKVEKVYMEYFYDFVLESKALQPGSSSSDDERVLEGENHWATINGLQVITLGHGVKDDPVASHEFYGTQKVIDDLKLMGPGWDCGYITL
jgi:hypothetical protein